MNTYIDRLEDELFSLSDRIQKLTQFTYTETYNTLKHAEEVMLDEQLDIMYKYAAILQRRLDAAKESK